MLGQFPGQHHVERLLGKRHRHRCAAASIVQMPGGRFRRLNSFGRFVDPGNVDGQFVEEAGEIATSAAGVEYFRTDGNPADADEMPQQPPRQSRRGQWALWERTKRKQPVHALPQTRRAGAVLCRICVGRNVLAGFGDREKSVRDRGSNSTERKKKTCPDAPSGRQCTALRRNGQCGFLTAAIAGLCWPSGPYGSCCTPGPVDSNLCAPDRSLSPWPPWPG